MEGEERGEESRKRGDRRRVVGRGCLGEKREEAPGGKDGGEGREDDVG